MLYLNLPELDQAQPPLFTDAASCRRWLAALPLANIHLAHTQVSTQLGLLNKFNLSPRVRLEINELLREPVASLQQEVARRYLDKPVPLTLPEDAMWRSVLALWRAMAVSYQLCLRASEDRAREAPDLLALTVQRCLRYTGLHMLEHYRVYHEAPYLWQELHQLYAFAEKNNLAERPVQDPLNHQTPTTHCSGTYAHALLMHLADPYRLTPRQHELLERWLDRWAARVTVTSIQPDSTLSLIGVDLDSASGPLVVHEAKPMADPRYLDTERFGATLRKRIKALRKGDNPGRIGLGIDCAQAEAEALLVILYRHWCEAVVKKRIFNRRPGVTQAQVTFGVPAIHFYLSGEKAFRQPGEADRLSRREMEDLALYGRVSALTEKMQAAPQGINLETWQILDESALGFRLIRQSGSTRISHNQLLAVRPSDGKQFAVGAVKWLIVTLGGELHLGVRILPGAPAAVAVRPATLMPTAANKFTQAFLLPEMQVLRETATLVLPRGLFQPGRILEMYTDRSETVRVHTLVEAGADYERVGFVRV
jgi:hypothetical protein